MNALVFKRFAAFALLATAGVALVHVPLHNPGNFNPLYWAGASNVAIVINSTGSDDIADGSHFTALRNAIDAWNRVPGSTAHLTENTSPTQQARTDFENGIHLILFDESNTSGYFPSGSNTVALTPIYFYASGQIADADILFNGVSFEFATDGDPAKFDVQNVATHELGHFLGLDHSGHAGASLYPYVSEGLIAQRSLSSDDEHGMRDRYPSQAFGTLTGTVRQLSDSSIVRGAHVFAIDADGRSVGGCLSNNSGVFRIEGLDAGTYTVCAAPLDFPVSSANLTTGHTIETDFAATLGAPTAVAAGATVAYGDFAVESDTNLSLGRASDTLPLVSTINASTTHTLRGSGLSATCSLQASDSLVSLTPLFWSGSTMVTFDVDVLAGANPGHVDIVVVNALGERAILAGAIEIVPPAPTVTNVAPPQSSDLGGTSLSIIGTGFRAGARVVIGSEIYVDGDAGGCTVVDANTITLTTNATSAGTYDVVVIDATGVEGRDASAHEFLAIPAIESVFPVAGSDLGGTLVTIVGTNFFDPMSVRIDGVTQTQVALISSSLLQVTTDAGITGGPYVLEIETPSAQLASSAFTYVAQADPAITTLTPATGGTSGGRTITLSGSNFDANMRVFFGVDATTGTGGTEASEVTFIDSATLEVTTPAHSQGEVAVMVQDDTSGQAHVQAAAFTFNAPSGGGGGGGGCYTVPSSDPWSWRSALAGSGWLAALAACLAFQAARSRRRLAREQRRAS